MSEGHAKHSWQTADEPAQTLPDRGHLLTEQQLAASGAIDAMSTEAVLGMINTQDTQVPIIVRQAIPAIARLIDDIAANMRVDGRLIYCGADAGARGHLKRIQRRLDQKTCPLFFWYALGWTEGVPAECVPAENRHTVRMRPRAILPLHQVDDDDAVAQSQEF